MPCMKRMTKATGKKGSVTKKVSKTPKKKKTSIKVKKY